MITLTLAVVVAAYVGLAAYVLSWPRTLPH
jgi:hypothetical protein